MTHKSKGGVTRRGLLWAGGLAAIPLPPAQAFDHEAAGMPWEGGRAVEIGVPIYIDRQPAGPYGPGNEFYGQGPWPKGGASKEG